MKKQTVLFAAILFAYAHSLFGQYPNVKVSSFGGVLRPCEESIMINPKNPNQIVIGVNGFTSDGYNMGYYSSSNGGYNWSAGEYLSNLGKPNGDPVIFCDTAGNFYFMGLGSSKLSRRVLDRLICIKSSNGGLSWTDACVLGLVAPRQNDKEYACVDLSSGSPYRNRFYVAWSVYDHYLHPVLGDSSVLMFCWSSNSGQSFTSPQRISRKSGYPFDSDSSITCAFPFTGPNGEVYVTFTYKDSVYMQRSTDGGNTWLTNDILVTPQVGGWTWTGSLSAGACDLSNSPYRGTLYYCFGDRRNGINDVDIFIVKSTNQGNTWSNPVRVNNDGTGNNQYRPWISVDPVTGYLWVVFYDNRYNKPYYDITVARSTNGGSSFSNIKVSSTSTIWNAHIGDYIGISAYNNRVRAAWDYNYNMANFDVWAVLIDTIYNTSLEHTPLLSTTDTSARTVLLGVYSQVPIAAGANASRLYYKTGNGSFQYVNANTSSQYSRTFWMPGKPQGTKVYYYFAVQDSLGTEVTTLPRGGGGLNPPGTIPPSSFFYYEVLRDNQICSSTVPKQINDFQTTRDTIVSNYPGYVALAKVNLNINHPNDGDLLLRLSKQGAGSCDLSIRNGQSGQNYTNTTFYDGATLPITQMPPPFTGEYRPQTPLSIFINQPVSGNWVLSVLDSAASNQGTLASWCMIFQVKSSVGIQEEGVPVKYALSQNYPNPFNSSTRISYSIIKSSDVTLKIYDMLGREVRTLVNEYQNAGNYIVMFNAGDLASGIYFYRLAADDYSSIRKLVLIK